MLEHIQNLFSKWKQPLGLDPVVDSETLSTKTLPTVSTPPLDPIQENQSWRDTSAWKEFKRNRSNPRRRTPSWIWIPTQKTWSFSVWWHTYTHQQGTWLASKDMHWSTTNLMLTQWHEFPIAQGEIPVKIWFLWWLEQVGENMMYLEYKNDIIIVDAGMLLGSELLWIDYIIPDISYLVQHKKKIRGILITHGHLDHIGALKHVLPELDFPMVYSSQLTILMIKKILEEERLDSKYKYKIVNPDMDIITLGCFTIECFRVNHNIPESMGFAIHTPKGLVVNTWDYKIDFTPAIDKPADLAKIARIGQEWVKIMLWESTNAGKPWRTSSEKLIWDNLDQMIKESKSRLIVTTFASNIGRVIQAIQSAIRYNRVVFLAWRSMNNNVAIVTQLGYINLPQWYVRKMGPDVEQLPDERVMVICTGAQWEEFAALSRMARDEFRDFKIRPGDKVLMSATAIPGNEKQVYSLIDTLIQKGIEIVTNNDLDIHASGHAHAEDIKIMTSLLKPEYLVPIHGTLSSRYANKKLWVEVGISPEKIFLCDNGGIIELYDGWVKLSEKPLKLDTVMIDWLGIWHLSWEYVMKARQTMSQDWVLVLVFKIDGKTKQLVGNIQIESRWFVYSSEVKSIHTMIVDFARKEFEKNGRKFKDVRHNLRLIKEDLTEYTVKTIGREPLIIPMFVYINADEQWNITDDLSQEDSIMGMTIHEQWSDNVSKE